MNKKIEKVAIVGGGFMGIQIAIVAAKFAGNTVKIYDVNPEAFERAEKIREALLSSQVAAGKISEQDKTGIKERISFFSELSAALAGADLVIEAVPEVLELKRKVFADLDRLAPLGAILASNSSTMPVSRMEDATRRPGKVVNIHFYPPIEQKNIVDLMGGTRTSPEVLEIAEGWIRRLHCLPLKVRKELLGFCFNRVWHAARLEALKMWAGGSVDFMDIDRAWMIFTGMPLGPFAMMDGIGLDVVLQVHRFYHEEYKDAFYRPPEALEKMVEKGELGMKTGKGFYAYPGPAFSKPDFLKP
jgi:3-hydroxybutyryl-CoA dehydrogenase